MCSISSRHERQELTRGIRTAGGDLVLVGVSLQQQSGQRCAHRVRRLGQAAAQHPRHVQQAVLRKPRAPQMGKGLGRGDVLRIADALVGVGPRDAHRLPHRDEELDRDARRLGDLARGQARLSRQDALDGQQGEPALRQRLSSSPRSRRRPQRGPEAAAPAPRARRRRVPPAARRPRTPPCDPMSRSPAVFDQVSSARSNRSCSSPLSRIFLTIAWPFCSSAWRMTPSTSTRFRA